MTIPQNILIRARVIGDRPSRFVSSSTVASIVARAKSVPTVVRWSFLLFVLTLPFEAVDLGIMTGYLSSARISGLLFFAIYFLHHNPLSHKRYFPPIPHAMWWFLVYIVVYTLKGFFVPAELLLDFFVRLFTLLQLVVLFWIASDFLKDGKTAKSVLLTYSIACIVIAFGNILGLPGFYETVMPGRVTALGENLTTLATHMGIATVVILGLHMNLALKNSIIRILLLLLTLPLFVVMANTASRGALAAFLIGSLVFLLPYWPSKRIFSAIIVILLAVGATYMLVSKPDFLERWLETYYEGRLARREEIFPAAIEMFLERPIFGWPPFDFEYELQFRALALWDSTDTHNLFLHLLLEVGVVGAIPFLVGLWLCGSAAWKARKGNLTVLPLALLLSTLVYNMSVMGLPWKPFWLAMALAIAAAARLTRPAETPASLYIRSRLANHNLRKPLRNHLNSHI